MARALPVPADGQTGQQGHPLRVSDIYSLLFSTMSRLLEDSNPETLTVDSLADSLKGQPEFAHLDLERVLTQTVVAALGWITMLFAWNPAPLMNHCSIRIGPPPLEPENRHVENYKRFAGMFIRQFGLIPHEYREEPRAENILHRSLLNLHSLAIVGRLHIEWVPYISQHLVLDMHTRTLRIFQYPSMCLLALAGGDYQKLCRRFVRLSYTIALCSCIINRPQAPWPASIPPSAACTGKCCCPSDLC
jgi:hypothetical protein